MKKLLIILLFYGLLCCSKGQVDYAPLGKYIYTNKSDYKITMQVYCRQKLYGTFVLNKTESDTIIIHDYSPFILRGNYSFINIDSLVVRFDSIRETVAIRKIVPKMDSSLLSIKGYDNNQEFENNSDKYTMYKTFTNKDFDKAKEIN